MVKQQFHIQKKSKEFSYDIKVLIYEKRKNGMKLSQIAEIFNTTIKESPIR